MNTSLLATSRTFVLMVTIVVASPPFKSFADGCLAIGCLAGTAADEFTADAAGLNREWILQLPSVAGGHGLAQVVIGDGLVVAQTTDGAVHAVQAAPWADGSPASGSPRPGSLLWSKRVDLNGGPVARVGIGPDLVAVPSLDGVDGLERSTGHMRWQRSLGQTPSSGATVIGNWVYVSTAAGHVTRLAVQPLRQPVEASATDGTSAKPKQSKKSAKKTKTKRQRTESLEPVAIHAGGNDDVVFAPVPLANGVLWCSSDGMLVTLQPGELDWRRLEFSLVNPPAGSPIGRDRSVFAATTAGDLARIDLPVNNKELRLAWHTVLPGPAFAGPFLSGDTLVVSLGDLGIAAYASDNGSERWHTCLTGTILAVGGGRVWLVDERGKLAAFDLADGTPRERLCLGPFTLPVVNIHSDRLLLASPSGMLVSLAPRGAAGTPTPTDTAPISPSVPARGSSGPAATPRP